METPFTYVTPADARRRARAARTRILAAYAKQSRRPLACRAFDDLFECAAPSPNRSLSTTHTPTMKTTPLPLIDLYRAANLRRVRLALAALTFYKLPGGGYCALLDDEAGYATVYNYDGRGTWIDAPPADVDRARMLQRPTLACPQLCARVMRDALHYVNRTAKTVALLSGDESRAEEIAGEIVAVLDAAEAWSLAVAEDDTLAEAFYRTRYTDADGFNTRDALDFDLSDALNRAVNALPPLPTTV